MESIYTASATSIGGRSGSIKSTDGVINLELRPPKEMGGPGGNYTNPEQLFAAGYAACFAGAYTHVALSKDIRVRPEVTAHVTINKVSDGFKLSVVMDIRVKGISQKEAEELAEGAHAFCPYSRATKGNIDVKLHVTATEK
ncbi:organic hydroperoxide resistance protein [Parabacteroides sp. OttesenSCG-928-G07]|nr:organic hydroperoxide resistance protein [Parabacteroides sp. OttesenSCG-928-G21]MDL2277879.1 organic hydroperoxide resistance protein [Parabacteroides sp. OttesenSCG-928-G07]